MTCGMDLLCWIILVTWAYNAFQDLLACKFLTQASTHPPRSNEVNHPSPFHPFPPTSSFPSPCWLTAVSQQGESGRQQFWSILNTNPCTKRQLSQLSNFIPRNFYDAPCVIPPLFGRVGSYRAERFHGAGFVA